MAFTRIKESFRERIPREKRRHEVYTFGKRKQSPKQD